MAKNLNDLLKDRPAERKNVDAHKTRMLEQVRLYRLRELREAWSPDAPQRSQQDSTKKKHHNPEQLIRWLAEGDKLLTPFLVSWGKVRNIVAPRTTPASR